MNSRPNRLNQPIDEETLRPRLRNGLLGKKIYAFSELKSTNDFAKQLARSGEEEGALIIADHQTKGRGRLQRKWLTPPGKGLAVSLILRPRLKTEALGLIALLSGLSIAQAVESQTGLKPALKWPNDVLLGSKKVSGILAESEIVGETPSFVIVGMGVNVNESRTDFPEEIRDSATSIGIETRQPLDRLGLLVQLLHLFEDNYQRLFNNRRNWLVAEWTKRCPFVQQRVKLLVNHREIHGDFERIDLAGRLILHTDAGLITINSGELF